MKFSSFLSRIDYRLSKNSFSRAQEQVRLLVKKLDGLISDKLDTLIDIGGGAPPQYKSLLSPLAKKYINLEIKKGIGVDLVGSVYDIPLPNASVDIVTLFMVLEHLSEPKAALTEVARVLKKGGYVAITTVQYWHTHNHPSDYLRYTKAGLEYYCKEAGFKIIDIWSQGGPFLVIFHAMELNMTGNWRTIFSILFYRLFDWLDWIVYKHNDTRVQSDSVGWSFIAKKL